MEDGEPAIEEEDVVGELHCCAASTAVGGGSEDWFLFVWCGSNKRDKVL